MTISPLATTPSPAASAGTGAATGVAPGVAPGDFLAILETALAAPGAETVAGQPAGTVPADAVPADAVPAGAVPADGDPVAGLALPTDVKHPGANAHGKAGGPPPGLAVAAAAHARSGKPDAPTKATEATEAEEPATATLDAAAVPTLAALAVPTSAAPIESTTPVVAPTESGTAEATTAVAPAAAGDRGTNSSGTSGSGHSADDGGSKADRTLHAAAPAAPATPAAHGDPGIPAAPATPATPATPGALTPVTAAQPTAPIASSAPAAPAAHTPSHQLDRVSAQVFPEVTSLVSRGNGTHRITLTLNPEQLGEVRVVMTMRAGAVHVRLAAGQDARQSLVDGSAELSRLLEHAGVSEARVVVRDLPTTATNPTAGSTSTPFGAASDRPMDQHAGTRADHPARDGADDHEPHREPVRREVRPTQLVTDSRLAGVDLTM